MATDIELINERTSSAVPLAAARLCNFHTGGATPLPAHLDWINGPFASALRNARTPWVDIFAYASKAGSAASNLALSKRRRDAVHNLVMKAVPNCGLISNREEAVGESLSAGDANDNSGYWRAVEVRAYGALPLGKAPAPLPPQPDPDPSPVPWWVDSLSVGGLTIIDGAGGGFSDGTIGFENVNTHEKAISNITLGGVSAGVGGKTRAGEAFDLFVKALVANRTVGALITWAINSVSAGVQSWSSWAMGPIFSMPGRGELNTAAFKGACVAIFVSGGFGPLSGGFYLLFMGKDDSLITLASRLYTWMSSPFAPAALAYAMLNNTHAVAIFPAASIGANLTLGGSGNIWIGRIS